jgi:hypothetical protein
MDESVKAASTLEPTVRSFILQRLHEVTGERQARDWASSVAGDVVWPPGLTEREITPGWRNDDEPSAWRPALLAAAIAIGLALAIWFLKSI